MKKIPIYLKTKGPRFIITGLPRSSTTWLSTLYMTDGVYCYHDPIGMNFTPEEMLAHDPNVPFGIACTSAWMYPDFLEKAALNGARVMIVERPLNEVNQSLNELGFPNLTEKVWNQFLTVPGPRIAHEEIFKIDSARRMWNWLRTDIEFDEKRFGLLKGRHIQPVFAQTIPDTEKFRNFLRYLHEESLKN